MKQQIFLSAILIWCFNFTFAQNLSWESEPKSEFEVWSVNGKASYTTEDGNSRMALKEGMMISEGASITLKKNASVELILDGRPIPKLNTKGTHSLSDLKDKTSESMASGEMNNFWAVVSEAFKGHGGGGPGGGDKGHGGGGPGGGDKGHGGGGPGGGDKGHGGGGPGGGDKGHGSGNFSILPIAPIGGGVAEGTINFSWKNREAGNKIYQIRLISEQVDYPLFSAVTSKTNFNINLDQIALNPNDQLFWMVKVVGEKGKKSDKISFNFVKEDVAEKVLSNLKGTIAYQDAGAFQKQLLEAVVFQKNDMDFLAKERYQTALKMKPNSRTAQVLYKAFLSDNGMEHLIEK